MYRPTAASLAAVPLHQRIQTLRRYYAGGLNAREADQLQGRPLEADLTLVPLPGAGVELGRIHGVVTRQPAPQSGADAILFVTGSAGFECETAGRGRRRCGPDDVLVTAFSDAPELAFDRAGTVRSVWIERRRLQARLPGIDLAGIDAVPAETIGVGMLFDYAEALAREAPLPPELLRLASDHLVELAALVIAAAGEVARAARESGERAARLAAIRADIAELFRLPAFSVDMVAARHGISARRVQKLFESAGTTFTECLLAARLEFARRRLTAPGQGRLRVSEVAFEVGFSDLSTFNRQFRRRYGASPTAVRARALEPDVAEDREAADGG